jgi:MFS family permease
LVARSLLAHRIGFLLIAALPLLVVTGRAEAFVGLLIVMTVPAALFGVAFNTAFADVVPEGRRAAVVSARNIVASGTVMALTPLIGRWLDLVGFPTNYQIAYLVGFLASLLGVRALSQLEAPSRRPGPVGKREAGPRSLRALLQMARQLVAQHGPFARIVLDTLVYGCGVWLLGPLYIIYYVRQLGATDGWIGTLTAVANLSAALGFYIWRRIIGRWGEGWPLRVTVPVTALYPILVALTGNLTAILVFAGLNGLVSPGLSISHFNTLLKVCPEDRRATFLALYTTVMNAGAFVCPLLGVALAGRIGIPATLFVGAGIWLLGAVLFSVLPVRPERRRGTADERG